MKNKEAWSSKQSEALYNIKHWSNGYVSVTDNGHLCANLGSVQNPQTIDLHNLVDDIKNTNMALPCLVRFPDILHDRIKNLCLAFNDALQNHQYQGAYSPVYPIKVNQEESVVSEIINNPYHDVGLEAGSKPELLTVLALSKPNGIIVCNGYKDSAYIRLALIGQQMGYKVFLVLERPSELNMVYEQAQNLGVTPNIGIRVRLDSISNTKWQNTGGEKAKFGLSSSQALEVIDQLQESGYSQCLKLLHFHLGSQITNIDDIEKGITECAHYYNELHKLGMNSLTYIDVGGGMGIDYDGTRSRNYFSTNYTVNDYANTIVATLTKLLNKNAVPHPTIITESGRAMVAHHAMLIVEVIDCESAIQFELDKSTSSHPLVVELQNNLEELNTQSRDILEIYYSSNKISEQIKSSFNMGHLTLLDKAIAEKYYYSLSSNIIKKLNSSNKSHREILDELNDRLADKYFCNFSLFQSLPDSWAINQIFPIVPLHRLDQAPNVRATLHDITCDSDGRIDKYVDSAGTESSLPLHRLNDKEPYYLGMFLIGAYQEILGDMHNLFGDTNSVNVCVENGGHKLSKIQQGDTIEYVLQCVHYSTDSFLDRYRLLLDAAQLSQNQYNQYYSELEGGLNGYTYLED